MGSKSSIGGLGSNPIISQKKESTYIFVEINIQILDPTLKTHQFLYEKAQSEDR